MQDFKANMFLLAAIERLLDEVGLIEALSALLHVSLEQLHAFLIIDLQALLAQDCPKGKIIADPLKLDAEHALDEEALGDGKNGDRFEHFQKQVIEAVFVVVL